MLHRVVTRIYFEPAVDDRVLAAVPRTRRPTLVAEARGPRAYHFDIHLQANDETVFFDVGRRLAARHARRRGRRSRALADAGEIGSDDARAIEAVRASPNWDAAGIEASGTAHASESLSACSTSCPARRP